MIRSDRGMDDLSDNEACHYIYEKARSRPSGLIVNRGVGRSCVIDSKPLDISQLVNSWSRDNQEYLVYTSYERADHDIQS